MQDNIPTKVCPNPLNQSIHGPMMVVNRSFPELYRQMKMMFSKRGVRVIMDRRSGSREMGKSIVRGSF
ncbi:MAG: hypothetical protein KC561_18755 [Myxococcales bacterium]|nr:hypothetical protein [Myxococcales bacterium]